MKRFHILLFIFTLTACEGLPDSPEGLRALADKMNTQQDTYEQTHHTWKSGDVTSTFTAYLDGDAVAFIEEHMTRGTSGTSINHYYFFNDQLFSYRETRNNTDNTQVEIEILFDPNGEVLAATQKQNNQPVAPATYLISMAQKHSQTLHQLAQDAPYMEHE